MASPTRLVHLYRMDVCWWAPEALGLTPLARLPAVRRSLQLSCVSRTGLATPTLPGSRPITLGSGQPSLSSPTQPKVGGMAAESQAEAHAEIDGVVVRAAADAAVVTQVDLGRRGESGAGQQADDGAVAHRR